MTTAERMKVEVWSDVMCPFCYLGKRRFAAALAQFPDSGAQDSEVFEQALELSLSHWRVHPGPDVPSRTTISRGEDTLTG